MSQKDQTIAQFVRTRNDQKKLFTAGPASLLPENLTGLRPCFGRNDADYAGLESMVLDLLKAMSGHDNIVRLQGSASLAMEVMALNFLYGRVLMVNTGYYAQRLSWLANSAQRRLGQVKNVVEVDWRQTGSIEGKFDWVFTCYTETSCGLKLPVEEMRALSERLGAKLMLDATGSIGLEPRHDLADVVGYSSCKGLFGLTGAAFIAYNEHPAVEVDSFYLRLQTHADKLMTGPYHTICSLADVLPNHDDFRAAVAENKNAFLDRVRDFLTVSQSHQPLLCTHISREIGSRDPLAVLYQPRSGVGGSVICHLGEVHLGGSARGAIFDALDLPVLADPGSAGGQ
jgi:aspartate aminotransferase-like enzyme